MRQPRVVRLDPRVLRLAGSVHPRKPAAARGTQETLLVSALPPPPPVHAQATSQPQLGAEGALAEPWFVAGIALDSRERIEVSLYFDDTPGLILDHHLFKHSLCLPSCCCHGESTLGGESMVHSEVERNGVSKWRPVMPVNDNGRGYGRVAT
jgi:hypothetical protein